MPGDPCKAAESMVRIGDFKKPPRRRLLDSDADHLVHGPLTARPENAESQREVACSAGRDGFTPPPA